MSEAGGAGGAGAGRSRARVWRDVAGLVRELWVAEPAAALVTLVVLVVGNASSGITVVAMSGVVDSLTGGGAGGHAVLFWVGLYVLGQALEEGYWTAKNLANDHLLDSASYRIQRRVLARAAAAPLIQLEEGSFFEHLQRASAGMGRRVVAVSLTVVDALQVLVNLGSIAVALAFVSPALPPLLVAGSLPALWLRAEAATAVYRAQREHAARDRIRAHLQGLLTGRGAAAEIRLFGAAGYLLGRWRRLRDERTRDVVAAERARALPETLGAEGAGVAYAASLGLVAALILRRELSVGGYVAAAMGALWFEQYLGALGGVLRGMEEEAQFLGDLFDFWRVARVETSPEDGLPEGAARVAGRTPRRGMAVEAEGLAFAYPGDARPAVRAVGLRIAPGERVAIVGENGAGKTTLVKLLIGLYPPAQGVVRLDGEALDAGRAVPLRGRIAAVFQDYATFHLTVRESIGFGDLARLRDDAALWEAAASAGIAGLIERLPGGLDASLGREFGDADVSGGQWQRVALARAFFRDADVLALDEPTAALDPLAELALVERFAELAAGRTAIMISHRLGMARLADRVVVLQDGAIVEEGRHDDLAAAGGAYARMFAAQAQWYR